MEDDFDIWDEETYRRIFGKERQENILDAFQGEDGIYRVPPLGEPTQDDELLQWKVYAGFYGVDLSANKDSTIRNIAST
jgi:hypothetical protein